MYYKNNKTVLIEEILFFSRTGVWTQDFVLAKQVLYHLSHTSSSEEIFIQHILCCKILSPRRNPQAEDRVYLGVQVYFETMGLWFDISEKNKKERQEKGQGQGQLRGSHL
jgi:hypothetical protein